MYGLFGFAFKLQLSTRPPEKFLGKVETWDFAEAQLRQALNNFKGNDWELNEGDGAFYGPKIDIIISDALQREFQCATIQLDYQAPLNFKLEYMAKADSAAVHAQNQQESEENKDKPAGELAAGRARPVIIHRAIIGSFERFLGIIIEHFGGKWPFWLSPRQILIVPVMPAVNDYVEELQSILRGDKLEVDVDVSSNTMQKKIRNGQLAQYNFIFGMLFYMKTFPSPLPLDSAAVFTNIDTYHQSLARKRRNRGRSTSATATTRRPRLRASLFLWRRPVPNCGLSASSAA